MRAAGRDLQSAQDAADRDSSAPGFALDGVRVAAKIDLVQQKRRARNVIGRLQVGDEPSDDFVVVGAVCLVVWLLSRARCHACCKQHAAAALLVGCAVCALNRSLEVSLSETLLFRPWIWLIMR